MQRALSTFPIPLKILSKLNLAGFDIVDHLKNYNPLNLSKEIGVTQRDSIDLLKLFFPEKFNTVAKESAETNKISRRAVIVNLFDFLREETRYQPVSTFSEKLDDLLGGGIPFSKITEICGGSGTGKTQICLQLCVNVQTLKFPGGMYGEALYIDTEGSFNVERIINIANATIQRYRINNERNKSAGKTLTTESILNGIHFYRCTNHIELIAIVTQLPELMTNHHEIRLIVIDSIAFPFQVQFEVKLNTRLRIMSELAQNLMRIATTNKLAVVLTNQMTTKIPNEGDSYLVPALGETWSHAATLRLILFWEDQIRRATLSKSPWKKETTIQFQITVDGIRDINVANQMKDENRKRQIHDEEPQTNKIKRL